MHKSDEFALLNSSVVTDKETLQTTPNTADNTKETIKPVYCALAIGP